MSQTTSEAAYMLKKQVLLGQKSYKFVSCIMPKTAMLNSDFYFSFFEYQNSNEQCGIYIF